MSQLPDRKRFRLARPARAIAESVARFTAAATWRTLNPGAREHYVEAPAPKPLNRLYYEADDGWRAPLLHIPAAPGGAGEPVLLAHTLGVGADGFRYGKGPTLASRLAAQGFSVYLFSHRGDQSAVAPEHAAGFDFDDILELDLPAALDRIRLHSGYPRIHYIGHGLGGQLGLAWCGRSCGDGLASIVALCAAVRFTVPRSEARRAALATGMLPSHWQLPASTFARLAAPLVNEGRGLLDRVEPGVSSPSRVRGVLEYATEDVPVGLLRQMARWFEHGSLVSRGGLLDYTEALVDCRLPLLVIVAEEDKVCPPEWATEAVETWGGVDRAVMRIHEHGHLDPLLAHDALYEVFEPVAEWIDSRRRLSWEREGEPISRFAIPAY